MNSSDGIWEQFLDDLQQQQHLTTYSLLVRGVSGRLDGQRLRILFNPDERQTYGFATREVHLEALRSSARRIIGTEAQVVLELSGSTVQPVVTGGPSAGQATPEPPAEVLHDIVDEPPAPELRRQIDVDELERSAAEISWDADEDGEEPQRPTAQDAITLFDATELEPEE